MARVARFGWLKSKRELLTEVYAERQRQREHNHQRLLNVSDETNALRRRTLDPLDLDQLLPATVSQIHYVFPGLFVQEQKDKAALHAQRMGAFANDCIVNE